MIDAEKIQKNWEKHLQIVEFFFKESPRYKNIQKLIKDLEDTLVTAPASTKQWYHNSFPGGYIDHVNRVVETAFKVRDLYKDLGGKIDFTDEELVFCALFHDLGKIGNGEKENYLVQDDKWRKDKLQENYKINGELPFMLACDRSLYLLQKYQIPLTEKEFIGIRTHDGPFDDTNKPYYVSYSPDSAFKSNLTYILFTADYLSSRAEGNIYKS